ncbi:TPA: hypothetical protein DIV55_04830 [Patescibacteria group bacterium]|uniref:Uncharacterized protein n=1 Tax=Candidatus Gottesmanbacteria bacterium GW2011_GWA1_43_11 TaxID=1618436 RepID=A0A0G1CEJ2_9BACT|nr:MAG: hypothetical protein UV59_C0031G0006 [Candidatus Gottesmanbacteria bacterium GW2011_GWA1_43_11]HCS79034.1 hypothetical protein [Patescibacteria group bacterium]
MHKKKHSGIHPLDVWPPPKKKIEEKRDPSEPKNKSYVDRFVEMQSEINAPVFEGEEETLVKDTENEEKEEKEGR